MVTDYHAKYYAHALTRRRSADDPDKLTTSLMNATVDLNPHQIDAASAEPFISRINGERS